MKQCPRCGIQYRDEFAFCERDSTPLIPEGAKSPKPPPGKPGSGFPIAAIAPVLALLVLIVGVVAFALSRSTPGKASHIGTNPHPVLPDVIGQSKEDASERLRGLGLRVVPTGVPTSSTPAGQVIGQTPPSGTQVASGTSVRVTISTGPAALSEGEVRAFLASWLSAQNSGSMPDYRALYAASFEGVKKTRDGGHRQYDYASWMKDRATMIKPGKDITIEARNTKITVNGAEAKVRFDQYYLSTPYSDWGPKVLHIRKTAKGLHITYEEMLISYRL